MLRRKINPIEHFIKQYRRWIYARIHSIAPSLGLISIDVEEIYGDVMFRLAKWGASKTPDSEHHFLNLANQCVKYAAINYAQAKWSRAKTANAYRDTVIVDERNDHLDLLWLEQEIAEAMQIATTMGGKSGRYFRSYIKNGGDTEAVADQLGATRRDVSKTVCDARRQLRTIKTSPFAQ